MNDKMKIKIVLGILIALIVAVCAVQLSLAAPLYNGNTFGTFKYNEDAELKQYYNGTACSIISIIYPNSTVAISNVTMTNVAYEYNYTLDNNYTQVVGKFVVNGECGGELWTYDFYITSTGSESSTGQSLVSLGLLVFVAAAMFFFGILGFKFMDGKQTWPIGLFFLIFAIIVSVYGLYLGVLYASDYYTTLYNVQSTVFMAALYGLIGIVFISMLFFILMVLKEIKLGKEKKRYGEDYDTKTKMYKY